MEIKIEIKSILGNVLFEFSKENNTLKDTLVEAVRRGANLGGANLRGAYLGGAYLEGAYLDSAGKLNSIDDILIVGPIGSRSAYTQIYRTDNGVYVKCGCFFGTLAEFADKVHVTHAGNKYERDYNALIEYAKIRFDIKK